MHFNLPYREINIIVKALNESQFFTNSRNLYFIVIKATHIVFYLLANKCNKY